MLVIGHSRCATEKDLSSFWKLLAVTAARRVAGTSLGALSLCTTLSKSDRLTEEEKYLHPNGVVPGPSPTTWFDLHSRWTEESHSTRIRPMLPFVAQPMEIWSGSAFTCNSQSSDLNIYLHIFFLGIYFEASISSDEQTMIHLKKKTFPLLCCRHGMMQMKVVQASMHCPRIIRDCR